MQDNMQGLFGQSPLCVPRLLEMTLFLSSCYPEHSTGEPYDLIQD